MAEFYVPGFPEEISERIDTPNIAELLRMPFFTAADPDDVRKHGTDFQRYLLDKTPLKHKNKYISVVSQVQYLTPSTRSIFHKALPNGDEWHIDCTGLWDEPDHMHLFISECTAKTEFNEVPFTLDIEEDTTAFDLAYLINLGDYPIKSRSIEAGHIVSFQKHLHRAVQPKEHEFRFMFRVLESDAKAPNKENHGMKTTSDSAVRGARSEDCMKPNMYHRADSTTIFLR